MSVRKAIWGLGIIVAFLVVLRSSKVVWAFEKDTQRAHAAAEEVGALTPLSLQLVDGAITVLSRGWENMSAEEQALFLQLYDPAGTGEINEVYVAKVLGNYHRIRAVLVSELEVVYEEQNNICREQRLYYTDLSRLHVCPYYFEEENEGRKARTLIHEMAHIALRAADRPYYDPRSEQYAELTPNGSWITGTPFIGRVLRELLRGDTLYHPDAYAHFALLNAGYTYICLDV
jgi:hypothetical protein